MKAHEFAAALEQILEKEAEPPNVEKLTNEDGLEAIRSLNGPIHQPYHIKINEHSHWYPKVFTKIGGMSGQFEGIGVILTHDGIYRFTMCHHEWNEGGANHQRGWHPAICKHCGFDASIDSGD